MKSENPKPQIKFTGELKKIDEKAKRGEPLTKDEFKRYKIAWDRIAGINVDETEPAGKDTDL